MKRFTVCIMVFLLMLWFSGNSVHAKTPNRLQVNSAVINMEDSENPKFYFSIDGRNFGDAPQVSLESYPLVVDPENRLNENDHIEAIFEGYIPPGTYRLSVARSGVHFSHPTKADSLDVTISDAKSGESGEPSGALERGNIYEIQETSFITDVGNAVIKCSCRDENDIALNGGYEISPPTDYPGHELTILKSNMYYRDEAYDYYELVVNNPITLHTPSEIQEIQIDVYLRCIEILNE